MNRRRKSKFIHKQVTERSSLCTKSCRNQKVSRSSATAPSRVYKNAALIGKYRTCNSVDTKSRSKVPLLPESEECASCAVSKIVYCYCILRGVPLRALYVPYPFSRVALSRWVEAWNSSLPSVMILTVLPKPTATLRFPNRVMGPGEATKRSSWKAAVGSSRSSGQSGLDRNSPVVESVQASQVSVSLVEMCVVVLVRLPKLKGVLVMLCFFARCFSADARATGSAE
jgi:hypothetical protein